MSVPSSSTAPVLGRSTPPTARTSVDLPAPFGPSSAVTWPVAISSETSLTTARPPRSTVRSRRTSDVLMLYPPLASGAPLGVAFPRRSSPAPQSRQHRAPSARSCHPQVGADHGVVAEHSGGRAGRDQLAEVEHSGGRAAGRDQAHVVVDPDGQRPG